MYDNDDETLVAHYFESLGYEVTKLPENKGKQGQRPDFKVSVSDQNTFYCEVKGPRDDWLENQAMEAERRGRLFYGGLRADPTFNRIARQLQKAIKQFRSENSDRLRPNVVCIINHDEHAGIADLYEVCTGFAPAESGLLDVGNRHIAKRLQDSKFWETVDLILWFDAKSNRVKPLPFFNLEGSFLQELCDAFGYDPASLIRQSA